MLSDDLRWNTHVNNHEIMKRNLYPCSESTKRSAYVTIVRPNMEYATAACMGSIQTGPD